ncbi:MAG: hypothetical protein HY700_19840 [Gemmatimonadetes bacterium]|nr:hypothetical protein [Gemmatimonadota bacterium]
MRLIDLRAVLQRTVSDVYGDLVTRRTGAAVRNGIEEELARWDGPAVIDFGAVRCLDLSCADEIVAKLVLQYGSSRFLFRGLTLSQRDALEPVLERHGLAVVVVTDGTGRVEVVGPRDEAARLLDELCQDGLVAESDGGYRTLVA